MVVRFAILVSSIFALSILSVPNASHCMAQTPFKLVRGTSGKIYRVYRPSYSGSANSSVSHASKRTRTPYRLDSGDVVAVIVQGVTGKFSDAPVHMPKDGDGTLPAVGHPLLVLDDGTLPMPLLDPVSVRGMTITQARDAIGKAYKDQKILKKDNLVTLSLMRKRTVNVSVLHDNPNLAMRGIANVKVPADNRTVIAALVGSGSFDPRADISVIRANGGSGSQLNDGDVVHVQSQPAGYFFTGGSLRGGQYGIPVGQSINPLQAISLAGGIRQQGILGPSEVVIIRRGGGAVRIGYAQLLNNPNAVRVLTGDTVIAR